MAALPFLFGNVNKEGRLESQQTLDEELCATLQDNTEYLDGILSSSLGISADLAASKGHGQDRLEEFTVKPQENAVDFSEIQETIEGGEAEEFILPPTISLPSAFAVPRPPALPLAADKRKAPVHKIMSNAQKDRLKSLKEDISNGRIRFTDMFGPGVPEKSTSDVSKGSLVPDRKATMHVVEDEGYRLGRDDRDLFYRLNEELEEWKDIVEEEEEQLQDGALDEMMDLDAPRTNNTRRKKLDKSIEKKYLPLELDVWEDRVVWDDSEPETMVESLPNANVTTVTPMETTKATQKQKYGMFRNEALDKGDWLDAILFEEGARRVLPRTFEDPAVTLDVEPVDMNGKPLPRVPSSLSTRRFAPSLTPGGPRKPLDKFNISDDWAYELKKNARQDLIRQVVGPAVIEHALPALQLHFQYFKPNHTTKDLRSYHRPAIRFPLNVDIRFSRVKVFKKKKAKAKDPSELMKSTKDISLKDTCPYVLLEYSEEYPMVLQNQGMASMIYNYYRKKDEKDSFVPKMTNGAAYILEQVDASPFYGFGDVAPGQTMQAVYNHLYRAPIFKHQVNETDFLLIKQSYKGKTKFFIREIPNLYVVGQCFPVQEIPRPQSRKIVQATKGRIQVVAYRYMRKDPLRRLKYSALSKAFPFYSEAELRNRIKEYLQYAKKGENTGWWKLHPKLTLPTEDAIRKIVTPETLCLMESMMVGQQRLKDSGYGNLVFNENDNPENEEESTDIEVMLAPWTTSKNFILAAQNKGMIQLFGAGDSSGAGLAFSFLRSSMKAMFFREGESEHAKAAFLDEKSRTTYHKFSIQEQQIIYRSEINRIWGAQLKSLTASASDQAKAAASTGRLVKSGSASSLNDAGDPVMEMDEDANNGDRETSRPPRSRRDLDSQSDIDETQSNATSSMFTGKNRILVINRLLRSSTTGQLEWQSEVITDMKVMSAYLRQRTLIEKTTNPGSVTPFTEDEERARRKKKIAEHLTSIRLNRKGKRKDDVDVVSDNSGSVTVKIPIHVPAYKRRKSEDLPSMKLVLKRKTPEMDLNLIFDRLVTQLIALPEAWPFVNPVDATMYPEYYQEIANPKTLQDIEKDTKAKKYRHRDEFLQDIRLIASNCRLFNGEQQISVIADGLVEKAETYIRDHSNEIEQIEVALGHPKTSVSFSLPSVPEAPDEVPLQQEGSSGQNQENIASGQSGSESAPQTPILLEELADVEEQEQSQPMDLGSEFIF